MAIQFIKDVNVNGDLTATRLIKLGGTSSQFLKADGSVDSTGYLSSVGLTMPVAFSVANSPLTANGTLEVTAIGTASQYIRGDGQLATLPASGGGGGSSVFYYLNGSVAASVATYKQMGNTPVIGGGTDFNLVGNGLIAQFLTDIGNPNRIQIPGGAWNFEMFFNMSSVGGNAKFYVELLKYNGATFTSIASNITVPEEITGGTSVDLYLTSIAVPETVLLTTDRLAIRVYIIDNSGGRTATLHTEDNTLCQVTTTFSAGVTSINGLTENTQYLAVGTAGSDFNISSLLDTHTFNLPTASSTNRGALSSSDWTTFNSKVGGIGTTNYISKFTGTGSTLGNSIVYDNGSNVGIGTIWPMYKLDVNGDISLSIGSYYKVGGTNLVNDSQYIPKATTLGYFVNSLIYDNGTNIGIGTTAPTQQLTTTGDAIIRNAYIGYIPAFGVNYASFSHASRNGTNDYSLLSENNGTTYLNASLVQSIKFRIGNFDKAIIDSNGNFGIGTTIPTAKLDVNGVIKGAGLDYHTLSVADGGAQLRLERTGSASGLMYIGADNVGFRVFDASFNTRLLVASGGNVGIGTTSPAYKLDVSGASGTDAFGLFSGGSGGTKGGIYLGNTGSQYGSLWFDNFTNNVVLSQNYTNGNLTFGTNSTERMRITSTGNVGIGTTSPGATLDVITESRVSYAAGSQYRMRFTNTDGNGRILVDGDESSLIFGTSASGTGSTATEKMRITSAGNIGIGTTSPSSALDVNGNVRVGNGTLSVPAYSFRNSTNTGFYLTDDGSGALINIGIGASNIATFKYNGNLLLGTTADNGARLQVSGGNLTVSDSASPRISVSGNGASGFPGYNLGNTTQQYEIIVRGNISNSFQIRNSTASTDLMTITSAGNVGIGTITPGHKLEVNGNGVFGVAKIGTWSVNTGFARFGHTSYDVGSNFGFLQSSTGDNYINGGTNYISGTNTNIFETAAAERMRITSAGNVGIGTTSPIAKLQAEIASSTGASGVDGIRFSNGLMALNFGVEATNNYSWIQSSLGGTGSKNLLLNPHGGNVGIGTTSPADKLQVQNGNLSLYSNSYSNTGLVRHFGTDSLEKYQQGLTTGGDFYQYTFSGLNHIFYTNNGFERMRITSTGNVGIGTTAPAGKLSVNGDLFLTSTGRSITFNSDTNLNTQIYEISGSINLYTGGQDRMRITSGGNVGIGTTSPGQLLTLGGSSDPQISIISNTTTGSSEIYFGDTGSVYRGLISYAHNGDSLNFHTAASEKMRITSSGNVGIGTTSPSAKLEVAQATTGEGLRVDGNGGGFALVVNGGTSYSTMMRLASIGDSYAGTAPPSNGLIVQGNVGIGTTSPAATAILDLSSSSKGFLPPRMTQGQRNAIVSPEIGLCVYCIDGYDGLYVYKATGWYQVA